MTDQQKLDVFVAHIRAYRGWSLETSRLSATAIYGSQATDEYWLRALALGDTP